MITSCNINFDVQGLIVKEHVTTMMECTSDNCVDDYVVKTVFLKKGINRIKIVGYECEDIVLELLSQDFGR